MTIQERMERMKNSTAYSPADAAEKVTEIAETVMYDFITNWEKETGMYNFPPDYRKYSEYCNSLKARAEENLSRADKSPYESKYGNPTADTVFALAFVLATIPNRFSAEEKPPVYYSLRMTLGDYLDALIDLSANEDGTADTSRAEQYRRLKKELSEGFDLSKPLCEAVGDIMKQYREPRIELDRVSHIINCSNGYRSQITYNEQQWEMREEFLENEYFYSDYKDEDYTQEESTEVGSVETDEAAVDEVPESDEYTPASFVDEEYINNADVDYEALAELHAIAYMLETDPLGYFLSIAKKPPEGKKLNLKLRRYRYEKLTDTLLLLSEDYSPEALKAKADEAELDPKFRELVDKLVTEKSVSDAFNRIDAIISKLYRLLVEPFADLGKYHFERHIAGEA